MIGIVLFNILLFIITVINAAPKRFFESACIVTFQVSLDADVNNFKAEDTVKADRADHCAYLCYRDACTAAVFTPATDPSTSGLCKRRFDISDKCSAGEITNYYKTMKPVYLQCFRCRPQKVQSELTFEAITSQPETSFATLKKQSFKTRPEAEIEENNELLKTTLVPSAELKTIAIGQEEIAKNLGTSTSANIEISSGARSKDKITGAESSRPVEVTQTEFEKQATFEHQSIHLEDSDMHASKIAAESKDSSLDVLKATTERSANDKIKFDKARLGEAESTENKPDKTFTTSVVGENEVKQFSKNAENELTESSIDASQKSLFILENRKKNLASSKHGIDSFRTFTQGCLVTFQVDPHSKRPAETSSGFQSSTTAQSAEICAGRCYQDGCTSAKYDPRSKECVLSYSGKHTCDNKKEHFFYEANETIWIHCTGCRKYKLGDQGIIIMYSDDKKIATEIGIKSKTESAIPAASEATIKSETEIEIPAATETAVGSETETAMPAATEATIKSERETEIPAATKTAVRSETETPIPAATEATIKSERETEIPAATKTAVRSETETAIPSVTEASLKLGTEIAIPATTETAIQLETETPIPAATEATIKSEITAAMGTVIKSETETATPAATEAGIKSETETTISAATEVATEDNAVSDAANLFFTEEQKIESTTADSDSFTKSEPASEQSMKDEEKSTERAIDNVINEISKSLSSSLSPSISPMTKISEEIEEFPTETIKVSQTSEDIADEISEEEAKIVSGTIKEIIDEISGNETTKVSRPAEEITDETAREEIKNVSGIAEETTDGVSGKETTEVSTTEEITDEISGNETTEISGIIKEKTDETLGERTTKVSGTEEKIPDASTVEKKGEISEEQSIDTNLTTVITEKAKESESQEEQQNVIEPLQKTLSKHDCTVLFQIRPIKPDFEEPTVKFTLPDPTATAKECAENCFVKGCTGAKFNPINRECLLTFDDHHQCDENKQQNELNETTEPLWIHCISCKKEVTKNILSLLSQEETTILPVTDEKSLQEENLAINESLTTLEPIKVDEKLSTSVNADIELESKKIVTSEFASDASEIDNKLVHQVASNDSITIPETSTINFDEQDDKNEAISDHREEAESSTETTAMPTLTIKETDDDIIGFVASIVANISGNGAEVDKKEEANAITEGLLTETNDIVSSVAPESTVITTHFEESSASNVKSFIEGNDSSTTEEMTVEKDVRVDSDVTISAISEATTSVTEERNASTISEENTDVTSGTLEKTSENGEFSFTKSFTESTTEQQFVEEDINNIIKTIVQSNDILLTGSTPMVAEGEIEEEASKKVVKGDHQVAAEEAIEKIDDLQVKTEEAETETDEVIEKVGDRHTIVGEKIEKVDENQRVTAEETMKKVEDHQITTEEIIEKGEEEDRQITTEEMIQKVKLEDHQATTEEIRKSGSLNNADQLITKEIELTTEPPVQAVSDLISILSRNEEIHELVGGDKQRENDAFAVIDNIPSIMDDDEQFITTATGTNQFQETFSGNFSKRIESTDEMTTRCPGRIEFEIFEIEKFSNLNIIEKIAVNTPAACARKCYETANCLLAVYKPNQNDGSASAICMLTNHLGTCLENENSIPQYKSNRSTFIISCLKCTKCDYVISPVTEMNRIEQLEIVLPALSIEQCSEICWQNNCTIAQYNNKSNLCSFTSMKKQQDCPEEKPFVVNDDEPVLLECIRCLI